MKRINFYQQIAIALSCTTGLMIGSLQITHANEVIKTSELDLVRKALEIFQIPQDEQAPSVQTEQIQSGQAASSVQTEQIQLSQEAPIVRTEQNRELPTLDIGIKSDKKKSGFGFGGFKDEDPHPSFRKSTLER